MGNEHVRLGIVRKIKFHIVIKWNNTKPVIRERPVRKCGSPKHTTKKKKQLNVTYTKNCKILNLGQFSQLPKCKTGG